MAKWLNEKSEIKIKIEMKLVIIQLNTVNIHKSYLVSNTYPSI